MPLFFCLMMVDIVQRFSDTRIAAMIGLQMTGFVQRCLISVHAAS